MCIRDRLNTALILFLILVSFMQKQVGMIYLAGMIVFVILLTAMCIPAIVILGRVEKAYEDNHDLNLSLIHILACGMLGGCGATKDADTTTLFPEKKGGITEVAVGDFDKDNYDENELEQYVKDSIKEYEDNDGAGTVKLKNLSVKDGVAKLGMHYSDSTAYSAFVGDTVFTLSLIHI